MKMEIYRRVKSRHREKSTEQKRAKKTHTAELNEKEWKGNRKTGEREKKPAASHREYIFCSVEQTDFFHFTDYGCSKKPFFGS